MEAVHQQQHGVSKFQISVVFKPFEFEGLSLCRLLSFSCHNSYSFITFRQLWVPHKIELLQLVWSFQVFKNLENPSKSDKIRPNQTRSALSDLSYLTQPQPLLSLGCPGLAGQWRGSRVGAHGAVGDVGPGAAGPGHSYHVSAGPAVQQRGEDPKSSQSWPVLGNLYGKHWETNGLLRVPQVSERSSYFWEL